MVVLLSRDGARHAVSRLPASCGNPDGFHRLVAGGVDLDGELGHEVVFVHNGRLEPDGVVPPEGAMLSDCGRPMPVEWRPVEGAKVSIPLYPNGADELVRRAVSLQDD